MDGLFSSFARLDSRISSVGQTATKIGDHLQVKLSYALQPYAYDPLSPLKLCYFMFSFIWYFLVRVQMLSEKLLVKQ